MEHRRAARFRDTQSPCGGHYATSHKDDPTPNVSFAAEIVSKAKDHVERKLMEAIHIHVADDTPTLNTDRGWQLSPKLPTP